MPVGATEVAPPVKFAEIRAFYVRWSGEVNMTLKFEAPLMSGSIRLLSGRFAEE